MERKRALIRMKEPFCWRETHLLLERNRPFIGEKATFCCWGRERPGVGEEEEEEEEEEKVYSKLTQ